MFVNLLVVFCLLFKQLNSASYEQNSFYSSTFILFSELSMLDRLISSFMDKPKCTLYHFNYHFVQFPIVFCNPWWMPALDPFNINRGKLFLLKLLLCVIVSSLSLPKSAINKRFSEYSNNECKQKTCTRHILAGWQHISEYSTMEKLYRHGQSSDMQHQSNNNNNNINCELCIFSPALVRLKLTKPTT